MPVVWSRGIGAILAGVSSSEFAATGELNGASSRANAIIVEPLRIRIPPFVVVDVPSFLRESSLCATTPYPAHPVQHPA